MEIISVSTPGQLADFVDLPFHLHKGSSNWIPPLKKQDLALLDPNKHPFWAHARGRLYLAIENDKIAGRIAALIDRKYNAYAGEACGSFGFFECEDNLAAADALLDAAARWLKDEGMDYMRGPLNPSTNYTCGLLVSGFEKRPAIMMPWNPPYYARLLENWGLRKEEDLFAWVIFRDKLVLSPFMQEEVSRLKQASTFTCRCARRATMKADIEAMLEIYRISWADNWGFVPLSAAEAAEHVRELQSIIDPRFFVLFYHEEKPVAGMVALPDLAPLLQRLNGRMGLLAPWHYLASRKEIARGLRIMLFGILPEYRLMGLPLLLLDYILEQARESPDLQWVEGSWILERNFAMNELMEDFSGVITRRYRIYRREIGRC